MTELPPLAPPWTRIPTIHETTDLFTDPTMDALDARYVGSGSGGTVPDGGTSGQVLTKDSGADQDISWQTPATVPDASTTTKGKVELATDAETITGTDTARAITPSNLTAWFAVQGYVGLNAQTGTTYTIVLTDVNKLVTLSNTSPITVTLPQDSSVAVAVGQRIDFAGINTGLVTFAAGSGATVNGTPSLVTRARYSAATAIKIAANTWLLVGDLA